MATLGACKIDRRRSDGASVSSLCGPRLQALDRMGKHEASKVQRMASLYGLRSSMQGAGRRRFVMVRSWAAKFLQSCGLVASTKLGRPERLAKISMHGCRWHSRLSCSAARKGSIVVSVTIPEPDLHDTAAGQVSSTNRTALPEGREAERLAALLVDQVTLNPVHDNRRAQARLVLNLASQRVPYESYRRLGLRYC